jgi:hypothetical protein
MPKSTKSNNKKKKKHKIKHKPKRNETKKINFPTEKFDPFLTIKCPFRTDKLVKRYTYNRTLKSSNVKKGIVKVISRESNDIKNGVIKHIDTVGIISETVSVVSKIITQVYQFINLYLIYLYDNGEDFPNITEDFVKSVIRIITIKDNRGNKPKNDTLILMEKLEEFYDKVYSNCIKQEDIQSSIGLGQILGYESTDMVKNIENVPREHYVNYVKRFVNVTFDVDVCIKNIDSNGDLTKDQKKKRKDKFYSDIRHIKKDLLEKGDDFKSPEVYHKWIKENKKHIIPNKKLEKDSVFYDVKCSPQDYLLPIFYISKEIERLNQGLDEEKQHKLMQIIPQRTSIVPKYITLDTTCLIELLLGYGKDLYRQQPSLYYKEIWSKFFHLEQREFKKKGYKFYNMIKTDGIGCSILFIKTKVDGSPIKVSKVIDKQVKEYEESLNMYINEIKITEEIKQKRLVTIDPNYSDIAYCLSKSEDPYVKNSYVEDPCVKVKDNDNKKVIKIINNIKHKTTTYGIKQKSEITFRYTQNQRAIDTRSRKYMKIRQKLKKETKINGKSVEEIEAKFSEVSSKTVNYKDFQNYCIIKNNVNRKLSEYYEQFIFRKLKFNSYINTQKSESKMISNFSKKFGPPEKILIVLGDFSKNQNMSGKEPTICKKTRKIFRKHKYDVFLIDEFRTSKLCNCCKSVCETFMKRRSPKPKHKGKEKLVWGLLRCKNENCNKLHNRDKNAAINMYNITKSILNGQGRPREFCREYAA